MSLMREPQALTYLLARRCFGLGLNLEEDIAFLRTWLSPSRKRQDGLNYTPYTLRKYHQYWHWMVWYSVAHRIRFSVIRREIYQC